MTGAERLYSTLVANCVFNAFLCYTAIALNIITIQALRNTSSLPCTLKTLLLSLAVSDLGVGLLVHPLYIARLVMNTEQSSNDSAHHGVYTVHLIIGYVFSNASFLGVVLLTVDRFLANSSSSQIQATCDTQAGYCCCHLKMAFKFRFLTI